MRCASSIIWSAYFLVLNGILGRDWKVLEGSNYELVHNIVLTVLAVCHCKLGSTIHFCKQVWNLVPSEQMIAYAHWSPR